MTHKEVSAMDIREVVKEEEWQALRLLLLGTWKKSPNRSVGWLIQYLTRIGKFDDGSGEVELEDACPLRLRRVHNYLTGTVFRSGTIKCESADILREKIRKIRSEI